MKQLFLTYRVKSKTSVKFMNGTGTAPIILYCTPMWKDHSEEKKIAQEKALKLCYYDIKTAQNS